ncbi:MAG: ParA family protein [Nitriliruptorales bacterium]
MDTQRGEERDVVASEPGQRRPPEPGYEWGPEGQAPSEPADSWSPGVEQEGHRGGAASVRRPALALAFANQKGGVGKTTSVINLGAALAELGNRVLLVDMDPQGSLGVGMGMEPHAVEHSVYNLLMGDETTVEDVLRETSVPRLHILPSNIDLAAAEILLVQEVAREQSLRRVLDRVRYRYDHILIDCPPSLGLLTINALTAADGVVIPLECEYFALRGMTLLMNTIEKVRERLNPELEVQGILPTMVDTRTIHAREVLARVHEAFGDLVFKTTVSRTIRFAEAPVAGEPILTYAPESKGADAYRDLAREVMSREPTG